MGYYVSVAGGFRLTPTATEEQRAALASADCGWRVSPDGTLLYLPSDESRKDVFTALKSLVAELLPRLGLVAEGEATWRGEDEAEGLVSIEGGKVTVTEPEPEQLSPAEVERLIQQLASGSEPQKLEAVEMLEYFGASSPDVLQALARALEDPSVQVRMRAAGGLAAIGPGALPVLGALIDALRQDEPWVQSAAAEAIGAIGPRAAAALPALRELQKHPSYGPSGRATEAIAKLTEGPRDS